MQHAERLQSLIRDVCAMFPDDESAPSVQLSWLEDKQVYYVSIARYARPFGQAKFVLLRETGPDLDECIAKVHAGIERVKEVLLD